MQALEATATLGLWTAWLEMEGEGGEDQPKPSGW